MKHSAHGEDLEAALRQAGLDKKAGVGWGSDFSTLAVVTTRHHRFSIDLRAGKIAASAAAVDMVRRSTEAHSAGTACPYCR